MGNKNLLSLIISMMIVTGIFCLSQSVYAQTTTISGRVMEAATQESLPGASVFIKGTTSGVSTDADGRFTIQVSNSDAILVVSFIGYKTQELVIGSRTEITFLLEEDFTRLDDVVVVAYGITRKEAATGAVGMLSSDELSKSTESSPEKALQGKIAGVQINNYSGQPGGGTEIYIRGISSINAGNQPLYVIDGVPVITGYYGYGVGNANIMSTINPADIESITVLKDAAASSIYGSRSSNGVVLITTKAGKAGKTRFEINAKTGVSVHSRTGDYRFMKPDELLQYTRDAIVNAGFDPNNALDPEHYYPMSLLDGPQTDWFKEVFKTGRTNSIDVSASGGNEKTMFFMSGGYYSEEGIVVGSSMERFNLTVNVDHEVSDRMKIGAKIRGSYSNSSDRPLELYYASPVYGAMNLLPWENAYKPDGSVNWDLPSNWNYNPVGIAEMDDRWDKFYRAMASAYIEYEFIEGLRFKSNNSVDYLDNEGRRYWNPLSPDGVDTNGSLWNGLTKNYNLLTSNTLNYTRELDQLGRIRALIGHEAQYTSYSQYGLNSKGIGSLIPYISNATSDQQYIDLSLSEMSLLSFFGILDYNYQDKYLLSASIRRDGCSRFSPDTKWGTFYSVGASWNIHNEPFMESVNFLNYLKYRLSYGTSGNYNIGNYQYFGSYGTNEYNNNSMSYPVRLANNDLTWEQNAEINTGIDANFFGRINMNFDFYHRITSDMLLNVPLPATTGFSSQRRNVGKMSNTGVELTVDFSILKSKNSNLNFAFNASHIQTKITDLAGETQMLDGWNRIFKLNENFSQWYVYDWAGVNPLTGMGMWYDTNGDLTESYSKARRVTKGQLEPKWTGGFSLNYSWKGLSISPMFEFKTGHSVYIMETRYSKSDGWYIGHNQAASQLDYWKKPGDMAENPKPIANNSSNSNAWTSSRWIEKGDYLRFKQLNINYSLPKKWMSSTGLGSVDIYIEASNIHVWHDVSYWDPERSYSGDTYASYPLAKRYIFGAKISF